MQKIITVFGGNPAKQIKKRFDDELTGLLLRFHRWNLEPMPLAEISPVLCDENLKKAR